MPAMTISSWLFHLPVPEPTFMPVDTARDLVLVSHLLPRPVLQAAAAVLEHASHRVREELDCTPGKRGNPAKRAQAERDRRDAADLRNAYCNAETCSGLCVCSVADVP